PFRLGARRAAPVCLRSSFQASANLSMSSSIEAPLVISLAPKYSSVRGITKNRESRPPYLPILQQPVRDFVQETGWPLKHVPVTHVQTHMWVGKVKLVLGPGDGDIK